jgi:benzoylformate decarboxylase
LPVISGKRAFLELLKQEGVEVLFGNPGTTELPLMDALAVDNDIRYVLGLQEAVVMAMATATRRPPASSRGQPARHARPRQRDGHAVRRAEGRLSDPGHAGQHDQDFNRTEPILYAELPPIARPLVKWSSEVNRIEDLPLLVHRACKTAMAPPTGPVFLSLPGDILKHEADIDLMAPTRVAPHTARRSRRDRGRGEDSERSETPVIMAGDAVAQSRALAELVELAELIGAPVYAELIANTASFPSSHPLFRGAMARSQTAMRKIFDQHDVLFSVGADLFALSLPSDVAPVSVRSEMIHLDVDPWELGKNYPAEVAILGDPKGTLPELTAALRERMSTARSAPRASG